MTRFNPILSNIILSLSFSRLARVYARLLDLYQITAVSFAAPLNRIDLIRVKFLVLEIN